MTTFTHAVGLVTFVALAVSVEADNFLDRQWAPASSLEAVSSDAQGTLLSEIEGELGTEHRRATEGRHAQIEEVARPTFEAMPKNEYGNLGNTAVRYTLHRFFVRRHGWFVRGLEPDGGAWNTSSALGFLEGKVPQNVLGLFEKRLVGRGLGLHELAVLAAMLENLAVSEATERLRVAFKAHSYPVEGTIDVEMMDKAIDTYMGVYILGPDILKELLDKVDSQDKFIAELYPNWPEAQQFVRQVRGEVVGSRSSFDFSAALGVVNGISDRFGRWQNRECLDLKHKLIAIEDGGSGCVHLGKFYHSGNWQFVETPEYLRQLGALDETDPTSPRVIVPNYVNSPSNCVATSNYYSLCCINECDDLFGHLERELRAADATPAEIAALVAALPSDTVPANRQISITLLQRLDQIAQAHGGRVPLHGRLFTQWMHNAYPHECEFPHVSGTTRPRTPEAFMAQTGQDMVVSDDVKQLFSARQRDLEPNSDEGECTPWEHVEELFVPWSAVTPQVQMEQAQGSHRWFQASAIAIVAALATMTVAIMRAWRGMLAAGAAGSPPKLLVV